jgi:pimeloyl-ACP methyl ester carboxylesterase
MIDYLQIDHQWLVYDSTGSSSSPPIILVLGHTSYRGVWTLMIESPEKDFYCNDPDLLGFGGSDRATYGDNTIVKQAGCVLKICRSDRLRKIHCYRPLHGEIGSTYLAVTTGHSADSNLSMLTAVW